MKTNVAKTIILSLVISALSTGFTATSASAQSSNLQGSETSAEIKYVGNNVDFFKFEVNLKQQNNQRLLLRILDENGQELYRENVNTKEFSKIVKFTRTDYSRLHFIVTGNNGVNYSKSFTINTEVSDNFLIRELN